MGFSMPFGKAKGTPVEEATEADLKWCFNAVATKLTENPDKPYADKDRQFLAAAKTELVRRCGLDPAEFVIPGAASRSAQQGGPPAAQRTGAPAGGAMQRAPQGAQMVVGTFGDAAKASAALIEAQRNYHLVAPATIVGRLPEGCELAVSLVHIDPYGPGVYSITGDRKNPKDDDTVGLDRVSLQKIAAAAGVTWVLSRRTDDGSHPHYCAWEAIARFQNFDMTHSDFPGSVEIDTREDGELLGAAAQEIRTKAAKSKFDRDGGDSQLLELRKFITRHAESKAMNRCIAARGVRRSYKRSELAKPFAVAKLLFTGHSDDPEARRDFRQMIGQRFLNASHQLYGGPQHVAAPTHALPAAPAYTTPALHAPPPTGGRIVDDPYGYEDDRDYVDAPPAQPTPKPRAPAQDSDGEQQEGFPT